MVYTIVAYVDIFPQWRPLCGRKCLIFGEFEKHPSFSSLKNRIVDYSISGLSSSIETSCGRAMIINFESWVYGEPDHYGIVLSGDAPLTKGAIVELTVEVPVLND